MAAAEWGCRHVIWLTLPATLYLALPNSAEIGLWCLYKQAIERHLSDVYLGTFLGGTIAIAHSCRALEHNSPASEPGNSCFPTPFVAFFGYRNLS